MAPPVVTTVTIDEDNSVTLPDWVLAGLDLVEGDELAFVKIPGQEGFYLEKVGKERESVPPAIPSSDGP